MIHLDTHVLVWLSAGEHERIPPTARGRLETDRLAISPMVELELGYLYEVGRVTTPAVDVLARLVPALELTVSNAPFAAVVAEALGLSWTRDPFDRLITAQALVDRAELLTADETILAHCRSAVWQAPEPGSG